MRHSKCRPPGGWLISPRDLLRAITLYIFFPTVLSSQVVFSEIMFDPEGPENTDEFVEVFNLSESDAFDLSGWRLGDGSGDDLIVDAGRGLLLLPRHFAVILDSDYQGHSTTYDSLIPKEALILSIEGSTLGSGGLSNSKSETVMLSDNMGRKVCQYAYSIGNQSGFSDEKVDLSGPDSTFNWADSYFRLGTPGKENSISLKSRDQSVKLSVRPDPFSPDGDGYEDVALISFDLPFTNDRSRLQIFDIRGRLIRDLIPGMTSGREGRIVWDGTDNEGNKARIGIYIVLLKSINSSAGKTVSAKALIHIASAL